MYSFQLEELVFYLLPIIYYVIAIRFKYMLTAFEFYQLNVAEFMLPLILVLVNIFGFMVFRFNISNIVTLICIILLTRLWYDMLVRVEVFSFRSFIRASANILFVAMNGFLISLIILRWILFFF